MLTYLLRNAAYLNDAYLLKNDDYLISIYQSITYLCRGILQRNHLESDNDDHHQRGSHMKTLELLHATVYKMKEMTLIHTPHTHGHQT